MKCKISKDDQVLFEKVMSENNIKFEYIKK